MDFTASEAPLRKSRKLQWHDAKNAAPLEYGSYLKKHFVINRKFLRATIRMRDFSTFTRELSLNKSTILHFIFIFTVVFYALGALTPSGVLAFTRTSQEVDNNDYTQNFTIEHDVRIRGNSIVDEDHESKDLKEFAPRFKTKLPNVYSKPEGNFVRLSCPALGNPEPSIVWTRNGLEIYRAIGRIRRTKWAISMDDLIPEDSDVYKCEVCNYLGCIKHSSKLIVTDNLYYKPIVVKPLVNLTLPLHGNGKMECEFIANPKSKTTWQFSACSSTTECANKIILDHEENVLSFTNVTFQKEGWYTCIGLNNFGSALSNAYLSVTDESILESNETTLTRFIRSPTSQELGNYDYNEDVDVRKTNDSFHLSSMDHDVNLGGSSTNEQDPENIPLRRNPEDFAPQFKKTLSSMYTKPSGNSVQLSCPALGSPEPTITWTRNGTKVTRVMGKIKRTKWAISMEDLVPEDSDIYTCKVCNYLGCITHSSKLIVTDRVNHKPIILKPPVNLTLPLHGSGEMECTFLSDLHSKKTWAFTPCNSTVGCTNQTFLNHDDDILKFTNVTFQNEGWYTCIEINGLGSSHSNAYLRVVNASMLESNGTTVTRFVRSHSVLITWVAVGVVVLFLFTAAFIFYVFRKLKHEKLLKQRIETVHQWTKKVIIYKPTSDSSGSLDTMIMPVVKIERQRTTLLQSSNSEPAALNEYEFPLDSNWEIPRNQLILGATLGEGAFGSVVKAEVNNTVVAVKMVKEGHTDDDIASLVREMEVMKIIGKHTNIINLLGCCSQNGPLYVIVEFAPHGNLKDFLNKNRPAPTNHYKDYGDHHRTHGVAGEPQYYLTEKHLISFAFQIARGMEYLASRRCIHRDLAARNVLVSDDYVMKIADFGLARDIQDTDYYRKNTNGRLPIKWMAPESLQDKFYDSQSDVWSYGILLWEIMTFGAQPYPAIMSAEELYGYLMSGQRMEKPQKCSLNIYMLMRQCWHFDASARPTFSEIVENLDKLLLANVDYLDVAVASLETPPSSSDDESDAESLRYHYK